MARFRTDSHTKSLATRKIPPQFPVTKCWASALVGKVWVKKMNHLSIALSNPDDYCCLGSNHVRKQLIMVAGAIIGLVHLKQMA